MTDDKVGHSGRIEQGGGLEKAIRATPQFLLSALILPTLPLLSLQRDALPIFRNALQRDKDEYIRTIDKFLFFQLHAVAMVLDPRRKLRGPGSGNLESTLAVELSQIIEKLMANAINLVEIQEIIIGRLIDVLNEAKDGRGINPDDASARVAVGAAEGSATRTEDAAEITTSSLLEIFQGSGRDAVLARLLELVRGAKGRVILSHLAEILNQRDASSKDQKSEANG